LAVLVAVMRFAAADWRSFDSMLGPGRKRHIVVGVLVVLEKKARQAEGRSMMHSRLAVADTAEVVYMEDQPEAECVAPYCNVRLPFEWQLLR
jgi:hypothetical protein